MKKLTTKWGTPIVTAALLIILSTALAGPARDPVSGTGSSHLTKMYPDEDLPEGVIMQFEGSVELLVRGEPKTAELVVNIYSVLENEEGVQHVSASHTLILADGSITTSDKEVAEPTETPGLYTINANMEVVSGTGIYEGVSGRLTAHGTIDFRTLPSAEFEIVGVISNVE